MNFLPKHENESVGGCGCHDKVFTGILGRKRNKQDKDLLHVTVTLPVVVQILLVPGQEGRGWLLLAEGGLGRRRERMTDGPGVVVHQPLVGRQWPGLRSRLPGNLPHGVLGPVHVGVGHLSGRVHGDQRAVALGVSEVPRGLADGTGETAEDGTGDQASGSPQSVIASQLLGLPILETELASLDTRHPAP